MATRCRSCFVLVVFLTLYSPTLQAAVITSREGDAFDADHIDDTLQELTYLRKNGYVAGTEEVDIIKEQNEEILRTALGNMQEFFELNVTGELDEETRSVMMKPRCGFSDLEMGSQHPLNTSHSNRVRRYDLIGRRFKWDTNRVTYGILNYPTNGFVTPKSLHYMFRKAFSVWSYYIPVTFRELKGRKANDALIRISFERGRHSRDEAHPQFDGPSGDLAHAFSPKTGWGDVDGDIHFDDAETFTIRGKSGYHMYQIAVHEIGHALGLLHSKNRNSIMWPMYRYWTENRLPNDDARGAQALYGIRYDWSKVPPRRTLFTGTYCGHNFPLVFSREGKIVAFRGYLYWEAEGRKLLTNEGGKEISDTWYTMPMNVGAAYEKPDGSMLFFKGNTYYEYRGPYRVQGYPRHIRDFGLREPVTGILPQGSRTYFFHGKTVSKYIEGKRQLAPGYPKPVGKVFPGIPNKVTNAFRHSDGHSYILTGKKYYRMSNSNMRPDWGYPRDFTVDFMGCNSPI